jgi:putative alpha-1,2-mannosidase
MLDHGKKFKIKANNRHFLNDPIKTLTFNGKKVHHFRIDHNELVEGGVLQLDY